jgi:hypothetical protein
MFTAVSALIGMFVLGIAAGAGGKFTGIFELGKLGKGAVGFGAACGVGIAVFG